MTPSHSVFSCWEIFQTDVARNFKDRPVRTDTSYTRNFRRRGLPHRSYVLPSRGSKVLRAWIFTYHLSLLIPRTEICKTANTHNLIGLLSARANISSALYVRFTRCRRKKNSRKWTWRREIFRVASGQTPDGIRGMEKLAGAAECNERKAEAKEKEETGRVRKWVGIVTAAGLRGPGGQDAKQKERKGIGGRLASLRKGEKRYLAVCDSNNENKPSLREV